MAPNRCARGERSTRSAVSADDERPTRRRRGFGSRHAELGRGFGVAGGGFGGDSPEVNGRHARDTRRTRRICRDGPRKTPAKSRHAPQFRRKRTPPRQPARVDPSLTACPAPTQAATPARVDPSPSRQAAEVEAAAPRESTVHHKQKPAATHADRRACRPFEHRAAEHRSRGARQPFTTNWSPVRAHAGRRASRPFAGCHRDSPRSLPGDSRACRPLDDAQPRASTVRRWRIAARTGVSTAQVTAHRACRPPMDTAESESPRASTLSTIPSPGVPPFGDAAPAVRTGSNGSNGATKPATTNRADQPSR